KNGDMSVKRIDTLPHVFIRALQDAGLDPADYDDKIAEITQRQTEWFKRVFLPVKSSVSSVLIAEAQDTANEMRLRGANDETRPITRDCDWCAYETRCRAELFGHDADFIRQREYVASQYHGDQKKADLEDEE